MLLQSFSHELRTPLNCSNQILTVIQSLVSGNEQLSKLVRQCLSSNILLINQLNDILDFAGFMCGSFHYKWHITDLAQLIEDIREIYKEALEEKKIAFQIITNLS